MGNLGGDGISAAIQDTSPDGAGTAVPHAGSRAPELDPSRGFARWLRQDLSQVDFAPRRFRLCPAAARERFESALRSSLFGFNAAILRQIPIIEEIPPNLRGFAYEGAGAACTILDLLTLTGGRRVRDLLAGPASRYPLLVHTGIGAGFARLSIRPMWGIRRAHPLYRWLAFDGYGFHQGFQHPDRLIGRRHATSLMDRTRLAVCDQGLGRLLWFHDGASPDDVATRIAEFPAGRRADLWTGVGLAATYTGGAEPDALHRLAAHAVADGYQAHLAQGSAFACAARVLAGIVPDHTVMAAPVLCGVEADEACAWTDAALIPLGHDPRTGDDYQAWRAGVRRSWARRNHGHLDA
jgi:hypothetical protein